VAESKEAAQLVIDKYGRPLESTDSLLTWHNVGPWKRADHLAMAGRPLADVRAEFGVPPRQR